ncbi:MAG: hypothetical protein IJ222_03355 [Bacteroidales bacterium]|nr:hypothetical protein [Bacteroidales bacterium]
MKVSNPNGRTVFSRNAKTVRLSEIQASAVEVSIGGYALGPLTPLNGTLDIPLRDVLAAYPFGTPQSSTFDAISGLSCVESVEITFAGKDTSEKATVHMDIIRGGNPSTLDDLACEFLTPGPQVQDIYPWSRFCLSELATPYGDAVYYSYDITVKAVLLRADGTQIADLELDENAGSTDNTSIFTQGLSVATLATLAELDDADGIAAIDTYAKISRETGDGEIQTFNTHKIRFVVRRGKGNYREFFFRNRFGAPDQVHSRGSLTLVPESEYSHFINGGELDGRNDKYTEAWEVNTGRFSGTDEQHLWEDFFRSDFRYIMNQDGTLLPIVISDVKMEAAVSGVNSASFKFKLCADPAAVAGRARTELADFSMDTVTGDASTDFGSGSGSTPGAISGPLLAERLDNIEAAIAKRRPIIPLTQAEYDALTSLEDAFYAIYEEED